MQVNARRWLAHRVAAGEITTDTAGSYRVALDRFSDAVGDRPIDARAVRRWQHSVGQLAPSTRRNHYSVVRAFLAHLVEEKQLRHNPLAKVRAPREPRRLPRALADAGPAVECGDVRSSLAVVLELQQGLRRVEVSRLELGDVDLIGGSMRVRGKGGHERVLPIMAQTRLALDRYLEERGHGPGPLFRSRTNPQRGITPATVGRMVSQAMLDTGVKSAYGDGVSGHCLRHTCLTDLVKGGAHLRDIQQAAGHAHLRATEVYLPLSVQGLDRAMQGRWYGNASTGAARLPFT